VWEKIRNTNSIEFYNRKTVLFRGKVISSLQFCIKPN
jgi:hypothetical protein